MPLQVGKVPIVVPRQKAFDEHVNDHQLDFCRAVAERQKNILLVEDINGLWSVIEDYDSLAAHLNSAHSSNNQRFCEEFSKLAEELLR